MNYLLAKYCLLFTQKMTAHADRIHNLRWAGRLLMFRNDFLFWDTLSTHTRSSPVALVKPTDVCCASLFPAFAHLPGMFPFFHLHLPGHISCGAIFWPKPDVSTSFFEPHKVPCLYLFWHLPHSLGFVLLSFGYLHTFTPLLGVKRHLTFVFPVPSTVPRT